MGCSGSAGTPPQQKAGYAPKLSAGDATVEKAACEGSDDTTLSKGEAAVKRIREEHERASSSSAPAPRADDASRTPERLSARSADDDLGWMATGSTTDAPTPTLAPILSRDQIRVQVLLEGAWRDSGEEENSQMAARLADGQLHFQIESRGMKYNIDFRDLDGASQTNVSTGKQRRLRLLDVKKDDEEDVDYADLRTTSFSKTESLKEKDIPLEIQRQLQYGPQSRRGGASQACLSVLEGHPHAQACFAEFQKNEERLCGEYAVFYHSYSFAALIYEVHAAVGSVLFRFRSQFATLPRILVKDFSWCDQPGEHPATSLVARFEKEFSTGKKDHDPLYRQVAMSVMCSLASTGPEACIPMVFVQGYSCKDLAFRGVLENVLQSCYVPVAQVPNLATKIIQLAEKCGLDVSQFGGKPCESGQAGHLLQVFLKRDLLDKLCYAAKPYGPKDEDRMPISRWMNSNESFAVGQARIVAHPKYFMQANRVRMFVASADKTFHQNRQAFQKELINLLDQILGREDTRAHAAKGIYGGSLPHWWTAEDQRMVDKSGKK